MTTTIVFKPRQPTQRLWVRVFSPILTYVFLFAACSGGDSTKDTFSIDHRPSGSHRAAESEAPTSPANTVPDFEIALFGNENHSYGERVRLSEFKGQAIVLNFWFPSCPPCRAEMPHLQSSFQRHKDNGVQFIGVQHVGLDSSDDGQDLTTELGLSYAIGPDIDNSILLDYEISSFPTTYFLDRRHHVVRKWQGPLTKEKLEEFIGVLLQ